MKTGLTFWDANENKAKWFRSKKWKYIIAACAVAGGVGASYGYQPIRNFVKQNVGIDLEAMDSGIRASLNSVVSVVKPAYETSPQKK